MRQNEEGPLGKGPLTGTATTANDGTTGAENESVEPEISSANGFGARSKKLTPKQAWLAKIDDAIIAAVAEDSPVTLRGVFYRVVSARAVDKTENGYRLIGRQLVKLRRSGRVAYADITDGTRWITKPTTWTGIDEMLADAASSYRRALWHDTDDEVMVFTEKDAISGVILPVTEAWDVPLGVLRGYCSESFAHSVAQSIINSNVRRTGTTYVYQLGDHDPSGVGAWDDFTRKVTAFIGADRPDIEDWVRFERLAVTPEQIAAYGLPTRPTKTKDPRAKGFGGGSVEVDAIRASTLRQIVSDAITQHIDQDAYEVQMIAERSEREIFSRMIGGASDG